MSKFQDCLRQDQIQPSTEMFDRVWASIPLSILDSIMMAIS